MELSLKVKLASLVVHVQEGTGETGHPFDERAAHCLAHDPEVEAWLAEIPPAMLPVKR